MERVRKGDTVVIVAGKNKGSSGEVLRVFPDADKVLVQGINVITKHVKPSQQNPQGGRIQREAPIHISNVMVADPRDGKPTRVRFNVLADGRKVRVSVRSGEQIDT